MRIFGLLPASAVGLCLLSGCGTGGSADVPADANRGDCSASIRFHGVVYIGSTRVDQTAPTGRTIGPGAVLDCDRRTVVERVLVSTVKGADSTQAIGVRGRYHGVYVAEALPHSRWPAVVRGG